MCFKISLNSGLLRTIFPRNLATWEIYSQGLKNKDTTEQKVSSKMQNLQNPSEANLMAWNSCSFPS